MILLQPSRVSTLNSVMSEFPNVEKLVVSVMNCPCGSSPKRFIPNTANMNIARKRSPPTFASVGAVSRSESNSARRLRAPRRILNRRPILNILRIVVPGPISTPASSGKDPTTMTKSNRFHGSFRYPLNVNAPTFKEHSKMKITVKTTFIVSPNDDVNLEVPVTHEPEQVLADEKPRLLRRRLFAVHDFVLLLLHLQRLRPALLPLGDEIHVPNHGGDASIPIDEHAEENVHPEQAPEEHERDEEEHVRRGVILLRLEVHLSRVHASVRELDPAVHGRDHEQRHHRLPDVVEIIHRVHPRARGRHAVRADERAGALIDVPDGAVRAPPKLPAEELHAEDAEDDKLEQTEEHDVANLRRALQQRRHQELHRSQPAHHSQRPQRAQRPETPNDAQVAPPEKDRDDGHDDDDAVEHVPPDPQVRALVHDQPLRDDATEHLDHEHGRERDVEVEQHRSERGRLLDRRVFDRERDGAQEYQRQDDRLEALIVRDHEHDSSERALGFKHEQGRVLHEHRRRLRAENLRLDDVLRDLVLRPFRRLHRRGDDDVAVWNAVEAAFLGPSLAAAQRRGHLRKREILRGVGKQRVVVVQWLDRRPSPARDLHAVHHPSRHVLGLVPLALDLEILRRGASRGRRDLARAGPAAARAVESEAHVLIERVVNLSEPTRAEVVRRSRGVEPGRGVSPEARVVFVRDVVVGQNAPVEPVAARSSNRFFRSRSSNAALSSRSFCALAAAPAAMSDAYARLLPASVPCASALKFCPLARAASILSATDPRPPIPAPPAPAPSSSDAASSSRGFHASVTGPGPRRGRRARRAEGVGRPGDGLGAAVSSPREKPSARSVARSHPPFEDSLLSITGPGTSYARDGLPFFFATFVSWSASDPPPNPPPTGRPWTGFAQVPPPLATGVRIPPSSTPPALSGGVVFASTPGSKDDRAGFPGV
eukprot:30108-Pelagococcus_subviridis.AAC.2